MKLFSYPPPSFWVMAFAVEDSESLKGEGAARCKELESLNDYMEQSLIH